MNNKQEQFLNYILKRVQDGKVDEAQALYDKVSQINKAKGNVLVKKAA